MSEIKAIETVYNGYRFRSRLEARWAVFFDSAGVKYEYEKEGFDLGQVGYYLPDFWLQEPSCWLEVKPKGVSGYNVAYDKLAYDTNHPLLLAIGNPWWHDNEWQYRITIYPTSDYDPKDEWVFGPGRISVLGGLYALSKQKRLITKRWQPLDFGYCKHVLFEAIMPEQEDMTRRLFAAGDKAQQARFEHGQKG